MYQDISDRAAPSWPASLLSALPTFTDQARPTSAVTRVAPRADSARTLSPCKENATPVVLERTLSRT